MGCFREGLGGGEGRAGRGWRVTAGEETLVINSFQGGATRLNLLVFNGLIGAILSTAI